MGGVHNLGTENPDDLDGHMEKNKLHVYSEREITLGDFGDVHGMRHIILRYLFPTIMMEIRTFHFRIPLVQGSQF